jgi:hypothetical protein
MASAVTRAVDSNPPLDPQLDQTSPYYVHRSDEPSWVTITPKLNDSNFHAWARSMKRALGSKMKLDFIDGSIPPVVDNFDTSFCAWNHCNMLVFSWILNSVSEQIASSVVFMENAVDVWNNLKERFSQGDLVRIYELMQEIYAMHQESKSITEFYFDLKVLWEEFEIYILIRTCNCRYQCSCESMRNARRNHTLLYAVHFLTGLNENFNVVKSQILLLDPLPPLNKIFSMDLQHERQGNFAIYDDSKTLINYADSPGKASYNSSARSSGGGNNPKGNHICSYCGRNNHIVENCYATHGFPPHMQKRSVNNASSSENLGDEAIPHDDSLPKKLEIATNG